MHIKNSICESLTDWKSFSRKLKEEEKEAMFKDSKIWILPDDIVVNLLISKFVFVCFFYILGVYNLEKEDNLGAIYYSLDKVKEFLLCDLC